MGCRRRSLGIVSWVVQRHRMCSGWWNELCYLGARGIHFQSCKEPYRKIGVQSLGWKRLKRFCGFGRWRMHFVLIEFAPKFLSRWYLKHETHPESAEEGWNAFCQPWSCRVRACFGCWVMTTERGHFRAITDIRSLAGMCQIVNYCVEL